jgi:VWFA-related protein
LPGRCGTTPQAAERQIFAVWEEINPVIQGFKAIALTALFGVSLYVSPVARPQAPQTSVPDAPAPQTPPPLTGDGPITPGKGAQGTPGVSNEPADGVGLSPAAPSASNDVSPQQTPAVQPPGPPAKDDFQTTPPAMGAAGITTFVENTTFVEVPVIVKDAKGKQVAGLTYRDFKVFENNTREVLRTFSVDPTPLSIAFVIDQSLTSDVMNKVNDSLGAIQGALTPYDEVAVFTYTNGPKEWTGFTGAEGNRVPAVLALAKATGADEQVPINSGPLAGCNIRENGNCVDPNLQPGRSAGNGTFITIPKEIHTLNDAILSAAKELSTRPKERLRIIYVISDGKEYGSKATLKEVIKYLQTNKIAVYATGVGASAVWGEGYVSRLHLPFTMYDNILFKYTYATGGDFDSERGVNGIEKSYAKIADEARNQYTLGYLSHESIYDGKYRSIDVHVDLPGLDVIAKKGYYPSAQGYK